MIVKKPWGYEEWFAQNEQYVGKLLFIKAGARLSYQYHEKKQETMYILDGEVVLTLGKVKIMAGAGCQSIDIPPKLAHRVKAITDTLIVEVSTPEVDDVVRIEDDYGRV